MDSLMKLPAAETIDLKKLRSIYDHTEGSARSLASVGIKPESYQSFVSILVKTKLPVEIRTEINKRLLGHDDDIEERIMIKLGSCKDYYKHLEKNYRLGRSVIMYHYPIKRNLLLLVLHSRLDISQQLQLCMLEMTK